MKEQRINKLTFGWLFNKHSWWIGLHYSPLNKRYCINIIPLFTFWVVKKGGIIPIKLNPKYELNDVLQK